MVARTRHLINRHDIMTAVCHSCNKLQSHDRWAWKAVRLTLDYVGYICPACQGNPKKLVREFLAEAESPPDDDEMTLELDM